MPSRKFILTRHSGAAAWIKSRIQIDQELSHINDLSMFNPGDEVYGVFPVHLDALMCAMGVRCFHLAFDVTLLKIQAHESTFHPSFDQRQHPAFRTRIQFTHIALQLH